MPGLIDTASWDTAELGRRWRSARPFPHLCLDGLVGQAARAELLSAFAEEPASRIHDEIFLVMASAAVVEHPALRRFQDALGAPEVLSALRAVTGKALGRVQMRAYAFLEGDYLLPHADHQEAIGRAVAYAYYLDTRALQGGELELFDCDLAGAEVVATRPALAIPPAPDRIVLFDVGDASLHQVREVTAGARLSLSGWFLP